MSDNLLNSIVNNKVFDSGTHAFEFNCTTIPNGVYFIKLSTGNENAIKKVIVLK